MGVFSVKHFKSPADKKKLLTRLRKVEGQVSAICRMVEEEKYCVDILLQISAVQGALGKAGQLLLGSHVETCVATAFASGNKKARQTSIDELMEVFARYGGISGR
ncbi:MAG: metal-sensitive transcriptional regulator [Myxococcales bacterium]|nr:metal-sensitive transcriptional regulator [Myxococcales bacterium]MCH7866463.1 metal-sensitive transcriptional regulator [Myxococcales bacterium]